MCPARLIAVLDESATTGMAYPAQVRVKHPRTALAQHPCLRHVRNFLAGWLKNPQIFLGHGHPDAESSEGLRQRHALPVRHRERAGRAATRAVEQLRTGDQPCQVRRPAPPVLQASRRSQ